MTRVPVLRKRRRTRESCAKASSESEGLSEDDCEEVELKERRWQRRRSCRDKKGKGKELAIEDDDEESWSSGSDDDEDEEDEEEEEEEPRPQQQQQKHKDGGTQQALDEICGICLSEGGNERGKLDCCEHFFCFGCIMEWAKVESRCPMCKQRFLNVTRPSVSGVSRSRTRSFRIPTRDQVYEPSEEEIRLFTDPYQNTVCTECQEAGDEGLLLLCDRCDAAAHTYCVGLGRSVPRGDWFCQACQTIDCESSSEDQDDMTLDTSDVEDEVVAGRDSILALLVADIQPNLFAGRTRHSSVHGTAPLRRSTRRRVRRSANFDSPGLSELITMSSTPRSAFIPGVMESYGAARTLFRQRQVQATVQNRLQNMRENWNRYQSGELQFPSARQGIETPRPGLEEAISLPSSSAPRVGHGARSAFATTRDVNSGEGPAPAQTRVGRSSEDVDIDQAWAAMDRARRLEARSVGASQPVPSRESSAPDRKSRDVKLQGSPVSARTRDRHIHGDVHSRANRSRVGPDRSSGEVDLNRAWDMMDQARRLEGSSAGASQRVATTRDRKNREVKLQESPVAARTRERHLQADVRSRANSSRGALD